MQFKIPQEINVEDKVVGPFTLKSFGFIFAFCTVVAVLVVVLRSSGLSLFGSIFLGAIIASPVLAVGFFPYNGKPAYTYSGHFVAFMFKPRKRVWKKDVKQVRMEPEKEETQEVVQGPPQKASLQEAEGEIEKLSLMVDTGGAYSSMQKKMPSEEPETFMDKGNVTVEKALQQTGEKIKPSTEPAISDLASVDPNKRFKYEQPDTAGYRVDEVIEKDVDK